MEPRRNAEGRENTETYENTTTRKKNTDGGENTETQENTETRRPPEWRRNANTHENTETRRNTESRGNTETNEATETRGNREVQLNPKRKIISEGNSDMQGVIHTQINEQAIESADILYTNRERNIMKQLHFPERRRKTQAEGIAETTVNTKMQGISEIRRNTGLERYPGWDSENTETEVNPIINERTIQKISTNVRSVVPKITDTVLSILDAIVDMINELKIQPRTIRNRFGGYEQSKKTLITTEAPAMKELTEDVLRRLITHYQTQLKAMTPENQEINR